MAGQGGGQRRVRARTARRATQRDQIKIGRKADRRGERVPLTVAGFEAALRDRGHDAIAEALIARHNQRLQRILHSSHMMQSIGLPLLACQFPMGLAAEELGAHPGRPPFYAGPTWPDHLAWGLDSVVAAVRLMLCLQPVGASIVARTQLERWSSNLQFNSGTDQQPGESTVDWYNALWTGPGVRPPDPVETPVGELFADLSELLHGRGRLMPLVWLDIADVTDMPSSEHVQLLETISDALIVSLSHIRTCLASAAEKEGFHVLARTVDRIRLVAPTGSWLSDLRTLLWPMLPMFIGQSGVEGPLGATAGAYRRVISAMQAGRQPAEPAELWPALALVEGAGWRRLNLLNRALGEFAHGSTKTSWNAARNALVTIQHAEALKEAHAQYTGRTHALNAMIFILAVECAAWADTFSSHLGDAYRRVVRVDDSRADKAIEALLNRAWEKRQTPLR